MRESLPEIEENLHKFCLAFSIFKRFCRMCSSNDKRLSIVLDRSAGGDTRYSDSHLKKYGTSCSVVYGSSGRILPASPQTLFLKYVTFHNLISETYNYET